ncbi:putative 1-aminocyclopropane-1-carboxylate deaminase [Xylariaceae sp. FL0804]|nr:putative 1-aminocyclopropane-1-carboxylate deaminase [Xylariaceae sp. FL0804]
MAALDLELPEPLASIPRVPLLFGPSAIHPLPRISAALSPPASSGDADGNDGRPPPPPPSVSVWAKRDDVNAGLAGGGGNKTRKLEYLAADARARGCDTLVSVGGVQSNHTRQVAGVAAALGMGCALVQERWVDVDEDGRERHHGADDAQGDGAGWGGKGKGKGKRDEEDGGHYARVGNIQLARLMGADVRLNTSASFGIGPRASLAALEAELRGAGRRPYAIPAGASDHPLGGLGFARWAFEVCAQEAALGVFFDVVVVCAVTGSTMAGMVAGFKLADKQHHHQGNRRRRRVVGIDASAKPKETFDQVLRIARRTAALIGLEEGDVGEADVELVDRYHAGAYGVPDAATLEAIRFGARTEAFVTDPVYEGKSLAGMMDMIRSGDIPAGSNVLYAHLGGQLALNAYPDIQ